MSTAEQGIKGTITEDLPEETLEYNPSSKNYNCSEDSSTETMQQTREKESIKNTCRIQSEENIEDDNTDETFIQSKPLQIFEILKKERDTALGVKENQEKIKRKTREKPKKAELYDRLYNEELRQPHKKTNSPIGRKQMLEMLSEKECKNKPTLGINTLAIALNKRRLSNHLSVENSLYEDAKRREREKKENEMSVMDFQDKAASSSKINEKSCYLARERLEKEFYEKAMCVDVLNEKKLSFQMLGDYFTLLGLFHAFNNPKIEQNSLKEGAFKRFLLQSQAQEQNFQTEIWNLLKAPNEEGIDMDVLIQLLILLYDSNAVKYDILFECITEFLETARETGKIILKKDSPEKLIKAFRKLKKAPYGSTKPKVLKCKERHNSGEFSPELNSRSRVLAERQFENYLLNCSQNNGEKESTDHQVPDEKSDYSPETSNIFSSSRSSSKAKQDARIKLLYEKDKKTQDKIKDLRIIEGRKARDACTFRPDVHKSPRNENCAARAEKRQINRQSSEDRLLSECTFKPQISKRNTSQASQQKDTKQKLPKTKESKENKIDSQSKFTSEKTKLLEVNVTITTGRTKILLLRKGDNPETEVNRFANLNKLDKEARIMLKQLVKKELGKIK